MIATRPAATDGRNLVGLAVGIAVGVAASRVLLDVHWLMGVIGGLALGWAWFAACGGGFGGRVLRFGAAAQTAAQPADVTVVGSPTARAGGATANGPSRARPRIGACRRTGAPTARP